MCEAEKRLNALKHQKNSRQKKLQLLQTEYNQLITDAEEVSNTDAGESAEAQVLNKTIIRDRYIYLSVLEITAGHQTLSHTFLILIQRCYITWSNSMFKHQNDFCCHDENPKELTYYTNNNYTTLYLLL